MPSAELIRETSSVRSGSRQYRSNVGAWRAYHKAMLATGVYLRGACFVCPEPARAPGSVAPGSERSAVPAPDRSPGS
jgi:hypothetical protein